MIKTILLGCGLCFWGVVQAADPGSVVFLHPDGSGMGHWYAGRLMQAGPDGQLNWDRVEKISVYDGHQKGWLSSSSHAGATAHAYGKKVHPNSFGMDRDQPLTAGSGAGQSIMQEAMAAGIRCGTPGGCGHWRKVGLCRSPSQTQAAHAGCGRQ